MCMKQLVATIAALFAAVAIAGMICFDSITETSASIEIVRITNVAEIDR